MNFFYELMKSILYEFNNNFSNTKYYCNIDRLIPYQIHWVLANHFFYELMKLMKSTNFYSYFHDFFDKNKMIFIHSNREITSFNTTKNVKDESANKLTTSKLIAYNGIMPTKIYDKIKVTGISMASGSTTLTPKSLIE